MRTILFISLALAACKGEPSRCKQGVHKVMELQTHTPLAAPSAEEQEVIDQIGEMTTQACEKEGLDQAQLDCILAMKTFEDMRTLAKCPAIAAKRPTWLMIPDAP